MALSSVAVPVPAVAGAFGAPVNCSSFGPDRAIAWGGAGPLDVVEFWLSNDGINYAVCAVGRGAPSSFNASQFPWVWIKAKRVKVDPAGAPVVAVSGDVLSSGAASGLPLVVPAVPGPGAAVDCSAYDLRRSFVFTGSNPADAVDVELSADGIEWVPVHRFFGVAGGACSWAGWPWRFIRANRRKGSSPVVLVAGVCPPSTGGGGSSPPFPVGTSLDAYFVEDSIDPQGRYQLNHFPPLDPGLAGGLLRLGRNTVDGDPTMAAHDGIDVWGPAPGQAPGSMTSALWGLARVKSERFGLEASVPAGQFYFFRVDGTELILRKLTDQRTLLEIGQTVDLVKLGWNVLEIGDALASDKLIRAKNAAANPPAIKWDQAGQLWSFSTDGTTFPLSINGLDAFGRHQVVFKALPNGAVPPQGGVFKTGANTVDGDPDMNIGGGFTGWGPNPSGAPYDAGNWSMARLDGADGIWWEISTTPGPGQFFVFLVDPTGLHVADLGNSPMIACSFSGRAFELRNNWTHILTDTGTAPGAFGGYIEFQTGAGAPASAGADGAGGGVFVWTGGKGGDCAVGGQMAGGGGYGGLTAGDGGANSGAGLGGGNGGQLYFNAGNGGATSVAGTFGGNGGGNGGTAGNGGNATDPTGTGGDGGNWAWLAGDGGNSPGGPGFCGQGGSWQLIGGTAGNDGAGNHGAPGFCWLSGSNGASGGEVRIEGGGAFDPAGVGGPLALGGGPWSAPGGTYGRIWLGTGTTHATDTVIGAWTRIAGSYEASPTAPGYLLDMETGAGGGHYDQATHTWVNGSSRKLKRDIQDPTMNLFSILDGIKIQEFRFRSEDESPLANGPAPLHVGFIAEETDPLLSGRNRDGQSLSDCVGLLLGVAQSLARRVKRLEAELAIERA